jgi:hypothetical protein
MKLFRLVAEWEDREGETGVHDYGVFSSFSTMKDAISAVLAEERDSLSPKDLAARRLEYSEQTVEVFNGLYFYRIFRSGEYELDQVRW